MNKELYEIHAEICKTLSNPVRLEIINLLRNKKRNVGELVNLTKISQSTISQHLTILRQKNLVLTKRNGKNIYYSLAYPEMIKACDIMRDILFKQLKKNEKLIKKIRSKNES
ncbi:winged helix-turn-helix transcriptional regulator [Candidatus Pacearchaeota archaeon]|nr:winged helix-turn-helix transcriptional regulator [Candidatus Pacearchaeota archaeon]